MRFRPQVKRYNILSVVIHPIRDIRESYQGFSK